VTSLRTLVDPALSEIYGETGPFVTVWLDATRSTENGEREVQLRWDDVRSEIARGATDVDEATASAIGEAILADRTPGPHGLLVVAAGGRVHLAAPLQNAPARSTGSLTPLPRLMPYLADRALGVPHLVVVADRTGADLLLVRAGGQSERDTVEGSNEYPLHRTSTADWSERHFQLRVENNWEVNARDVADAVARHVARDQVRLVVIAGDVRARSLIAEELGGLNGVAVRTVEEGGRAAGSSTEALEQAVRDQVLHEIWHERREVLEHLQQNLGRGEYAVAGVQPVIDALRAAQVDTVVLADDPSSTISAWVGPDATHFGLADRVGEEASAFGLQHTERDRFDSALVRAVVGTGAELVIVPGRHDLLPEGIGALLRYDPSARA